MKKFFSIVLVLLIAVSSTACGTNTALKTVYGFSDSSYNIFYGKISIEKQSWFEEAEQLPVAFQEEVNDLLEDVCKYINETFNVNWQTEPIEAYGSSVLEETNNHELNYGAVYYDGKFYIDSSLVGKLEGQLKYVVTHELLHYLYEINAKEQFFALENGEYYTGRTLEEAFVDSLAKRYIEARVQNVEPEIFASGYKLARFGIDILAVAVPDVFSYFLNNDIDGLKKAVDELAGNFVDCRESAFVTLASMLDECILVQDVDILSQRLSEILYFLACITPKYKASEFICLGNEFGFDLEDFTQLMY